MSYQRLLLLIIIMTTVKSPLHSRSDCIKDWGDLHQIALPTFAFLYSLSINDHQGAGQLAKAGILTMGSVYAIKYAANCRRPYGGRFSFPSGHTASAFWGAAYIQHRYGLSYGMPFYMAATLVGYSRVRAEKHYAIDAIAGAVIAFGANKFFVSPYCCKPFVNANEIGVTWEKSY